MSELVDYQRAASTYDRGRALPDDSIARWQATVASRLPAGPLRRVVDVGAGTGLFLPMWCALGARRIVAVEPSAAMRDQAAARRIDRARIVAGTAAELPVATGSVDVTWLSTVVHHFPDLDAAATELARVVRPGGRVLVRGFLPDVSRVPWLDRLPGAGKARRRFPTADRLGDVLRRAGFTVHDVVNVAEPRGHRASDVVTWIETMRDADSILTALSDDDIARGVHALRRLGDQRLEPTTISLLTADAVERRGARTPSSGRAHRG
jgi:ubiquinone/menaquinone biosynthesis C-methylase UbiE